jgi:uncharacterized protein YdaU (DUF1376 family)
LPGIFSKQQFGEATDVKIKYVQLESQAFLTDLDFVMMSAAERGVYCTLLLHLYCSGGRCKLDPIALGRLCNCRNFEKFWGKIAGKFQTRKGVIRHKRVSKELRRAKRFAQRQRIAGLASAKKRQPRFNHGSNAVTTEVEPKKRKGKVKEREGKAVTNTNTFDLASSFSSSVRPVAGLTESRRRPPASGVEGVESIAEIIQRLGLSREAGSKALGAIDNREGQPEHRAADPPRGRLADASRGLHFHQALTDIIHPRTRSDRTCFRNVAKWLTRRCAEGNFTKDTFAMALGFAEEAKSARNPAAAFMALLKKELRYPNG